MVVPAPLLGVVGYPRLDFVGDGCDERAFACGTGVFILEADFRGLVRYVVLGRIVGLEADDDAFFAAVAIAVSTVFVFRPGAEGDDAGSHFVHFLREAQVECGRASE